MIKDNERKNGCIVRRMANVDQVSRRTVFSATVRPYLSPRRRRKRYDPLLSAPLSPVPFSTVCQPLYSRARYTRILRQRLSAEWLTRDSAEPTNPFDYPPPRTKIQSHCARQRIPKDSLSSARARVTVQIDGRLATESEFDPRISLLPPRILTA